MAWSEPLLYERLTWPEVRRAASEARVALIPVATLEDHGPHLPIDADLRIAAELCRRVAEELPKDTVLLPAIPHGYSPHHMDFPGAITIGWDTFTRYCTDVARSLAHHGFRRLLYLNGHGSNQNFDPEIGVGIPKASLNTSTVSTSFASLMNSSIPVASPLFDNDRNDGFSPENSPLLSSASMVVSSARSVINTRVCLSCAS